TSTLWKSGGYGYVASSSIHQGASSFTEGAGGNFETDSTFLSGAKTVLFQIDIGRVNNFTFYQNAFPVLSFGSIEVQPTYSALISRVDTGVVMGVQSYRDQWAFQWDLSSYDLSGTPAFEVSWTGEKNAGIYALQLNQGNSFTEVVPEPSTWILLGLGAS